MIATVAVVILRHSLESLKVEDRRAADEQLQLFPPAIVKELLRANVYLSFALRRKAEYNNTTIVTMYHLAR